MLYFVYILECSDKTYYIGSTSDLIKRLYQHNHAKKGAHYTKIRRPVVLRYVEEYTSLQQARSREVALKKLPRSKKEFLIATKNNVHNPGLSS